jgi:hypothetical protein
MNRKSTFLIAVVIVSIISFVFYQYSSEPTSKVVEDNPKNETLSTEVSDSSAISWEVKENPPVGNDISTYSLYLRVDEKVYDIKEYFNEDLYGCRDFAKIARPEGTSAPEGSLSDQLCYVMAGGDLFYIVESGNGYQVLHKVVGDVPSEDIKEPEILFTF